MRERIEVDGGSEKKGRERERGNSTMQSRDFSATKRTGLYERISQFYFDRFVDRTVEH